MEALPQVNNSLNTFAIGSFYIRWTRGRSFSNRNKGKNIMRCSGRRAPALVSTEQNGVEEQGIKLYSGVMVRTHNLTVKASESH